MHEPEDEPFSKDKGLPLGGAPALRHALVLNWIDTGETGRLGFEQDEGEARLPASVKAVARWKYLSLGQNAAVVFLRLSCEERMRLHVTLEEASPVLLLEVIVAGTHSVRLHGKRVFEKTTADYSLDTRDKKEAIFSYAPQKDFESIILFLSRDYLKELLAGEVCSGPIQAFLDGRPDDFIASFHGTPTLHFLAQRMGLHSYAGAAARLYLKGCLLRVMAEVITDLAKIQKTSGRVLSSDIRRAVSARDILLENLGSPPSAEELAREVGLSQRQLNDLFHSVYGGSVATCLNLWRLTFACQLLKNEKISIKQVAHNLGYAHSSNFVTAFSRRFGLSPRRWRIEQRGRDESPIAEG